MPYDVAFSLDETERLAYCIVFGQFEGMQWDWGSMAFKERT